MSSSVQSSLAEVFLEVMNEVMCEHVNVIISSHLYLKFSLAFCFI